MDALKWHSLLDSLIMVGLRYMPERHTVSKCNLNSGPVSYIISTARVSHNQILSINRDIRSVDLSKIFL